jgi:hypothetical protein
MGSNNVREKAEAAYDALDMREKSEIAAQHPRYCYAKGYTAALAVAPTTAQPVAVRDERLNKENADKAYIYDRVRRDLMAWRRELLGSTTDSHAMDHLIVVHHEVTKRLAALPATAVEEARGAVSSLAFARRVLVATLLDHDEIVCGDWRIECELDPANLTERFAFSTPKGETMYDTAEEAVDALLAAEAADEGHTLAAKESRSDDRPAAGQGGGRG